ncbi:MAG: metallophosphoesterase, partial [Clostridia bacterium]|nr:metallophosphoesterase [Clostridia bacterium]
TTDQYVQVFYEGVSAAEESIVMSGANSEKAEVDVDKAGEYFTYTMNFDNANWEGASITKLRLDPMNVQGTFDIDYIMLCKSTDTLDWQFASGMEGWAKPYNSVVGTYTAENGVVKGEVTSAMGNVDTQLALSGLSINPALYKKIEFIGSINITAETAVSDTLKLYYAYKDSNGEIQGYNETKAFQYTTPVTTNGEYRRFVFDISDRSSYLIGSTITSLRLDFINNYGSFEIDSMRFIGADTITEPLDASQVAVSYSFANSETGCAKGTIKMNYGDQSADNALNVILKWASGNATDGYTPLADYTALYNFKGTESAEGYTIEKDLLIPEEATALVAQIRDSEKVFSVACDIPEAKRIEKGEPEFVLALASDFHFGGPGSATEEANFHKKVREHINANADALAVVGDITQWYGAYSGEAYDTMVDDDPDNDNLTAGVSQFDMATDHFKQYNIPVYMIQGNHDTPEGKFTPELTNGATSAERYKDYLANWLDYSFENGMYEDEIIRETITRNGVEQLATFYDDYINGYHLICLRAPHEGDYTMADGELDWLDAKLYEYEESGKPVFVFTHAPLTGTVGVNGAWQFTNDEYGEIIAKHPNVIAVSGHSHFTLNSADIITSINGKGEAPSFVHDGALVNTCDPIFDDEGNYLRYSGVTERSMWTYAEIYDDRVITRGYSLVDGKYVSQALGYITLKPACTIDELVVNSSASGDNVTYTASSATDGLTYQWYVDGTAAETTGASITVAADFEGYLAVRATDADGQYRSMSYNTNKNGR